jgi:hypothetical protein
VQRPNQMPKKKGVGKRKVQETPEEKQMRLEMEELKVLCFSQIETWNHVFAPRSPRLLSICRRCRNQKSVFLTETGRRQKPRVSYEEETNRKIGGRSFVFEVNSMPCVFGALYIVVMIALCPK